MKFVIPARGKPDRVQDNVSLGDVVTYSFDFTPWEEDNNPITSATWTNEAGTVGISGQDVTDGILSAELTFNQSGKALVSILAVTAVQQKKVWLEVNVKDYDQYSNDYGMN